MISLFVRLMVLVVVMVLPLPAWAVTITENFNCANSAGNLTCQNTWTDVFGTATLGIVSNQAKGAGAPATYDGIGRMEVDGDLTQLMTAQVTLASISDGGGDHFTRGGVCLQVSETATYDAYCFYIQLNSGGQVLHMLKVVNGTGTDLGSVGFAAAANDVYKLTWNPSNNQLIGSVNAVAKITVTDSAITTHARAGIYYGSQAAGAVAIFDTFSLDPQAPAAGTILQQGGRRGRF